jgi:hypothetical protein
LFPLFFFLPFLLPFFDFLFFFFKNLLRRFFFRYFFDDGSSSPAYFFFFLNTLFLRGISCTSSGDSSSCCGADFLLFTLLLDFLRSVYASGDFDYSALLIAAFFRELGGSEAVLGLLSAINFDYFALGFSLV